MSKTVIVLETIKTGEVRYVAGVSLNSKVTKFTSNVKEAMGFAGANVLDPLKSAKSNISPNDTRVYTTSA